MENSLYKAVDLGRSTDTGHPRLWTFLFPGHAPATPDSTPAQTQPVHQPFPHRCVLVATERKTGCRDQVGRTRSSRPPTCMTKGAHPPGVFGHATFTESLVPSKIQDWPLTSSFSSNLWLHLGSDLRLSWLGCVGEGCPGTCKSGWVDDPVGHGIGEHVAPFSEERDGQANAQRQRRRRPPADPFPESLILPFTFRAESTYTLARSKRSSRPTDMVWAASSYFLTIWSKACNALSFWRDPADLTQNQQSSAGREDVTRAAWQWGEERVRWVALWEGINVEILDFPQTPIPVMDFTLARAKKCYCCLSPTYLGVLQSHEQNASPQSHHPPQSSPVALSQGGTANAPGWTLLLTCHQLCWHQGHQRAEAKLGSIWTSLSTCHSPLKTFSHE